MKCDYLEQLKFQTPIFDLICYPILNTLEQIYPAVFSIWVNSGKVNMNHIHMLFFFLFQLRGKTEIEMQAQTGPEVMILLPQLTICCNYRCASSEQRKYFNNMILQLILLLLKGKWDISVAFQHTNCWNLGMFEKEQHGCR